MSPSVTFSDIEVPLRFRVYRVLRRWASIRKVTPTSQTVCELWQKSATGASAPCEGGVLLELRRALRGEFPDREIQISTTRLGKATIQKLVVYIAGL